MKFQESIMCEEVEEFDEEEQESPEMHVHVFLFMTEIVDADAAICKRIVDSYHYVGTELYFFEEMMDMPGKDKWRRIHESTIKSMILRTQMCGQRGSALYSLKVNVDEEMMRVLMVNNPMWVQDLCKKSGVMLA